MKSTMHLHLTKDSRIADIQQQFNVCYPYLKLQFSAQHIHVGATHVKRSLIPSDTLLRSITHMEFPCQIDIDQSMTVARLERCFEQKTGLHVQVFRSSGSLWLITTATDQWSLEKQNREGEELSQKPNEEIEPLDIHEQE
jgi:hypothetical protein